MEEIKYSGKESPSQYNRNMDGMSPASAAVVLKVKYPFTPPPPSSAPPFSLPYPGKGQGTIYFNLSESLLSSFSWPQLHRFPCLPLVFSFFSF